MRALDRAVILALGIGALGCGGTAHSESPSPPPKALLPEPYRARGPAAAELNRQCETCHVEQAREWRGSPHQRAELDPVYRRAFALEPLPFCQGCHAPEADPSERVPVALAELGVGCVSCHLSGEEIVAGPGRASTKAPHPLRREAEFASDQACAACHEFRFPGQSALMQSTVSEHRRSSFAGQACASCHMPKNASGRKAHDFSGHATHAALRAALRATAERRGRRLHFRLESRGVGHAFPTGDLFRRLEVSAEAIGSDYLSADHAVAYLTRTFDRRVHPNGAPRRLLADTRLGENGSSFVELDLELTPTVEGYPVSWRVAYQRVEHPVTTGDEDAVLSADVPLAEGILEATEQ